MNLQIKGTTYKVQLYKNFGYSGETNIKEKTISIEADEDLEELRRTIMHELLHAYFFECGLNCFCNNETLISWLEKHIDEICKLSDDVLNNLSNQKAK